MRKFSVFLLLFAGMAAAVAQQPDAQRSGVVSAKSSQPVVRPSKAISLPDRQQQGGKRPKVGLVLGGGGAKGAAEVGALKVIERAGIPIDYIAGTSIGAIVGGLYAVGYRAEALDSMFRSQEWLALLADWDEETGSKIYSERNGVKYVFGFPVSRKGSKQNDGLFGAVKGDKIIEFLYDATRLRDSVNFNELPIPFRCVATDVKNMSEVVLDRGSLPLSMRASMAVPGVFKPVRIGRKTLVDGGVMNNLPVDVVREMGADIVIAIDLTQNQRETRDFSLKDLTGIGGVLDWMVSRPDVRKYNRNKKETDIYIHPLLPDYNAASFKKQSICQMIFIGEKTGERSWKQLEELKQSLEAYSFGTDFRKVKNGK